VQCSVSAMLTVAGASRFAPTPGLARRQRRRYDESVRFRHNDQERKGNMTMKTPVLDREIPAHPALPFDPGVKEFCFQRLKELAQLWPGWDAQAAPRIDPATIEAVRRFVESLPDQIASRPMVVPLTSGNVQLEWHHGRRVLELEFETPATVHFLQWDPEGGVEREDVIPASNRDELTALIRWFMEGLRNG